MLFLSVFIFCIINVLHNVPVKSASVVDTSTIAIADSSTESVNVTSSSAMGLINTTKYSNTLETDMSSNVSLLDPSSSIYAIFNVNHCSKWKQPNHIYFQIANAFFLVSLLAPRGVCGLVFLRIAILLTSCFTCLWAWTVECYFDAVLWNGAFIFVNLMYIIGLLYHLRPIKFDKEIEEVYSALFAPLRVSRRQFVRVLSCMRAVRHLKPHELHAQEKVTKVDSLSLVLSGKLVVSQNQRALHIVFPHHFLDSPEWFGVSTDEYFQVSIMAIEESRILVWHRDKLKLSIMTDAFLQSVFDHILGRDVVHKLMQVSETMGASNGHLPNSHEEDEDKPMLLIKKAGDGPGITALLSRQLQDEHVPLLTTRMTNCTTPPAVRTHAC